MKTFLLALAACLLISPQLSASPPLASRPRDEKERAVAAALIAAGRQDLVVETLERMRAPSGAAPRVPAAARGAAATAPSVVRTTAESDPTAEQAKAAAALAYDGSGWLDRIQLRGRVEDHTFNLQHASRETRLAAFKKAQSAQFYYLHDFTKDNDVWSAKGAVIAEIIDFDRGRKRQEAREKDLQPAPPPGLDRLEKPSFSLRSASLLGAVTFERTTVSVSKSEGGKVAEANLLVPSLIGAFSWEIPKNALSLFRVDLDLAASFATDFDFKSRIASASLDLKPAFTLPGNLTTAPLFGGAVEAYWKIAGHLEASHVYTRGAKVELRAAGNSLRVGPKLSIGATKFFSDRLSIDLSYRHYYNVHASTRDNHRLTITGSFRPFPTNHPYFESVLLSLVYDRGRVQIADDKVNQLQLTLGIKF